MAAQDTALRLIQKHGRSILVVKRGVTPKDAAKPWRGPAAVETGGDAIEVACSGVFDVIKQEPFLQAPTVTETAASILRGRKFLYVAALQDQGHRLDKFDAVVDGADTWEIVGGELIQPGADKIVYKLEVKQ